MRIYKPMSEETKAKLRASLRLWHAKHSKKPMSKDTKEKLSAALRAKYASGTRKPNPPETYLSFSVNIKAQYASGKRVPPTLTRQQALERAGRRDMVKVAEQCRRLGRAKLGKPNVAGPSAAGPDNMFAKYWCLKAPNQQVIEGKNLNEIIRQHSHLFKPEDVVWKKSQCRASKGIRQLINRNKDKKPPNSWKGWRLKSRADAPPNNTKGS